MGMNLLNCDACNTAKEMWTAIEGYNIGGIVERQDVKTNLFWELGKFTSRDENPWRTEIDTVFISQAVCSEALNYYQEPKPQQTDCTIHTLHSSSTDQGATTRQKAKRTQTRYPQLRVSFEDAVIQKQAGGIRICKRLPTPCYPEDTTPRYNNDNQSGQFGNQRTMTVAGARETVGSLVFTSSCASDWLEDTDEEIDEQELEAHYSYMAKIQEVSPAESSSTDTPLEQKDDSDVIPDSSNYIFPYDTSDLQSDLPKMGKELALFQRRVDQNWIKAKTYSGTKGKSVETQFDKPSVVRQPNAQRIPKPSVLGKPTPFSNSPEMRSFQTNKSVNKTNASDGLFKPVTQQSLPQNRNQAVRNTNVLKPGMFRIASTTTQTRTPQLPHASRNTNPHMSKSSGVIHTTSVSRPQLKSYQVKDKVVPNISQVKFTKKEVEDNHRISSISKKTKSVTACNDSLNSRTSNVNAVCADCGKCVFNSDHDACVSRYLKDVNARTKSLRKCPI
ncbi:hypothetical protein Tco_0706713 [Tanacetum coccineum]|uniref:Uncharacterized protein n=1 Tax=Tanacetum coccineum TaxID=301880 RepID=A0ABQ4YAG4_9ASTR